jgi:hypothetical protein
LLERYDFEPFPKKSTTKARYIKQRVNQVFKRWSKDKDLKDGFDVVVLVDHGKGGLSESLLEALRAHPLIKKKARWYARSKDPEAGWIKSAREYLRLLVLGPTKLSLEADSWFCGTKLSPGALQWLVQRAGGELRISDSRNSRHYTWKRPKCSIVAFHHDNRAAGLIVHPSGQTSVFATSQIPTIPSIRVGRTSVVFSSLVASFEYLLADGSPDQRITTHDLERALDYSHLWCKKNENTLNLTRFADHKNLSFRHTFEEIYSSSSEPPSVYKVQEHNLRDGDRGELDLWEQAFNMEELGAVTPTSSIRVNDGSQDSDEMLPEIQVWRSWSSIEGFIAVSEDKKREISRLHRAVAEFSKADSPRRPLSAMIYAPPGWGKSYLVQKLAENLDMEYLEFNTTHLTSIQDLVACFDTVSSVQTRKTGRRLLVFWDEINAELQSEEVYSYFLGPIWTGVYRRGGQTFQLQPCAWIFASSKLPDTGKNRDRLKTQSSAKGSDFRSRINGPIVNLCKQDRGKGSKFVTAAERLYMGVALVKRHYPDVMRISRAVLRYLRDIRPKYGFRSLEFIVSRFHNIKHGEVTCGNLPPKEEVKEWISGKAVPRCSKKEDNVYYRIFTDPRE